jgi:hypothetical protein
VTKIKRDNDTWGRMTWPKLIEFHLWNAVDAVTDRYWRWLR